MMSLSAIGPGLTRFGCTVLQVGKKYAPQIMTYTGIAGFIATVVYACKATTKAEQILAERDKKMAEIEECSDDESIEYSEADREKDIHVVTVQTRWDLVKCYTPVVTLGLASTALILGGHHIIQARSASYAAAFKASEKAFRAYREAVAKKYGEDPEKTYLDVQESDILAREKKKQETVYLTCSEDDPIFKKGYKYIKGEYLGEGNKAYSKLNMLNASVLFSTTPSLDVFQWKRSKVNSLVCLIFRRGSMLAGF